ncbi:MAG: hypothetical protein K2O42_06035 [Oscillospiraceae bacterium]|nr:hypothetical protein [Oscillospiraceae bacterium]
MWQAKWNSMKLRNPETNKTWRISVEGNHITTQLENRTPKTIEVKYADEKAVQLIMAQLRKGFIYSNPDAAIWEPCFHTYLNRIYPGFLPIAANRNRNDFYVFRVAGQFEDEVIFHFDSSGKYLNSYHLGKDRLTYRAKLLDDGRIVLNSTYSSYNRMIIELFYPNGEKIEEIQEGELLDTFKDTDDHADTFDDFKISYIGYDDPYNRGIFKVEDIKSNKLITEFFNEFISKNAFCAFSSNKLIVHTDNGVLSLYNIP